MSKAISALDGKVAAGEVTVREMGLQGMITVRGDLSSNKLGSVAKKITGQKMPDQGKAAVENGTGLVWMSPDEVLILLPHADVDAALAQIGKALKNRHHLAVDVSDARAMFRLEGAFAREVMAKLSPQDLHPDAFGPGDARRTRLGQVAAAYWMRDEDTFEIVCFRSVAHYLFDVLAKSASDGPVGHMAG